MYKTNKKFICKQRCCPAHSANFHSLRISQHKWGTEVTPRKSPSNSGSPALQGNAKEA